MIKKSFCVTICIIFIISSFSFLSAGELKDFNKSKEVLTSSHIIINSENAYNIANRLKSDGFDVLGDTITKTSFQLIVTPSELSYLKSKGFSPEIISYGRPFIEIQNERQQNTIGQLPPGYLDHEDIIAEMYDFQSSYPSICKVFDLTETYSMPPTYEERHIYAIKISDNVEEDEDEPTFLMVSCHHAREVITPVIALYSIDQFTSNYGSDPDITALVNEYEIWISPVWNPDGYEYVYYVDNMWRKNRQPYSPGVGVDLNRNYPFGWDSSCSGSTDPNSETYKGPSSASEVETQIMIKFSNDQHFSKVLDYHSHGSEVLYGYCCHSHPFSSFYQSEATEISIAAGYGGSIRQPSAEGENYEWQIANNGSYAYLMETHTTFQPDYNSALAEAEKVWPGTLWILQRPISVMGHVKDSLTGDPVVAKIQIEDVSFSNEEEFYSEPTFGRYHLILPPGSYELEFSSDNYNSKVQQVTVTESSSVSFEIELDRFNEKPNNPSIDGPREGIPNEEYCYTISGTDPEDDNLEYYIQWGDDTCEEWIGPYSSGEEFNINHSWENQGKFFIKVKSRDIFGEESSWVTITINIPRTREYDYLFIRLIERYSLFFRFIINLLNFYWVLK